MKATINIEKITPQQAIIMLDNKIEQQRPVRKSWVDSLSNEMSLGAFKLSCDAIVLVKNRLANGQHRLGAVVQSGLSQEFLIMRTDDEELYKVIDSGVKRRVSDVFSGITYAVQVSAAANMIVKYNKKYLTPLGSTRDTIARSEIIEFVKENSEELVNIAAFCKSQGMNHPILTTTLSSALIFIAGKSNRQTAEEFITKIYSGANPGTAAHIMRERLIQNSLAKSKLPTSYIFGLLIKAFKSHLNGTAPGVLRIGESEEFPRI